MSLLSCPSAQQLYYTESLHPLLELPLIATMPTDTEPRQGHVYQNEREPRVVCPQFAYTFVILQKSL